MSTAISDVPGFWSCTGMTNMISNLQGEQPGHPRASQVAPNNYVCLTKSQPSISLFFRQNIIQSQHLISDHPSFQPCQWGSEGGRAASMKAGVAELILVLLLGMATSASPPNFCPHEGKARFIIQVIDYQEDRKIFQYI